MSGKIVRASLALCFLILSACGSGVPAAAPQPSQVAQSEFHYIALGDSLAAGVLDGTTNEHTQPHSYAVILAKQLGKTFGGSLAMPLLAVDGTRKNPEVIPTLLGISGEDSRSIFETKADGNPLNSTSSLHDRSLAPIAFADHRAEATSQLDAGLWLAEQWKNAPSSVPNIITLWLNNDVLGAIVQIGNENYTGAGINAAMTSPENFRSNMDFVLQKLANTGAKVFVGNIPDITQIAYLVSRDTVTRWTRLSIPESLLPEGARMSLPAALRIYADFLGGRDWEETLTEHLSDKSVMTSEEMDLIHDRILAFNQIIAELSGKYSIHEVDLYGSLHAPQTIEGDVYTSEWGAGGFFCLDGVHFSHSGHAFVANLFIRTINATIGTAVPEIEVSQVRRNDPYIDKDGDGFMPGPDYEPSIPIVQLLFQFRDANDSDPEIGIRGTAATIHELKALAIDP